MRKLIQAKRIYCLEYEDCEVVVEELRSLSREVPVRGDAIENVNGGEGWSWGRRILGSVGSQRAVLRADGPVEGDDSKETNIAVDLLTTDAMVDWKSG